MTWSPLRHSLNLNGPLATVGAVFSGAASMFFVGSLSTVYLPKMCVGSGPAVVPNAFTSAGQKAFVNFTLNFLGFDLSTWMPEIAVAVPLHVAGPTQ